jgi:hypothetical protein
MIREYLWLDGRPLAVVEGGQTFWLHWDHILRPVLATDATGAVVWAARYLPFGGIDQVLADTGASVHGYARPSPARGTDPNGQAVMAWSAPLVPDRIIRRRWRGSGRRGDRRPVYSSASGLPRSRLTSPRCVFSASRRLFEPGVGRVGTRRFGATAALAISATSRASASSRLRGWLR